MQKRIKGKASDEPAVSMQATEDEATADGEEFAGQDIAQLVEGLLAVLGHHDAAATDGVLSLLTAFMQAADRVMQVSTPEETEQNRAALLGMLDHAKRFVDGWPHRTPEGWRVH
jgi:hypothetical protein